MPEQIQPELAERYLSRAGFFWRQVRDSRFADWQKSLCDASWQRLDWNWSELGISEAGRQASVNLRFFSCEVFAHPDVLSAHPELADYYRLLACLPNKGLAQIKTGAVAHNTIALCKLLNGFLSSLLTTTAKASRESLLNTMFAEAGSEWQGSWVTSIGLQASHAVEQILANYAVEHGLLDLAATTKLAEKHSGLALKSGTILLFGSEPDVKCRNKERELVCVIEIKGSTDKAGAQTRLGETKKSFTKAKLENPRCHTILLASVLTPAVEKQLKTEREIDQVFDLLAILKDEGKRSEFLNELFKFHLRENI